MNLRAFTFLLLANLLLLVPATDPARATDWEDQLGRLLSETRVARFRFREVKNLRGLRRPLQSRGLMIYSRERGLYRRITEPIEQEQLITPGGVLVERSASGETQRLSLSARGGRGMVTSVFSLFSGNFDELRRYGELSLSGDTQSWSLTYDLGETRFPLKRVSVRGSKRYVRKMTMLYDGGDSIVTTFTEVDFKRDLSPRESRLFGALEGD